jgi:hypothetical protein
MNTGNTWANLALQEGRLSPAPAHLFPALLPLRHSPVQHLKFPSHPNSAPEQGFGHPLLASGCTIRAGHRSLVPDPLETPEQSILSSDETERTAEAVVSLHWTH